MPMIIWNLGLYCEKYQDTELTAAIKFITTASLLIAKIRIKGRSERHS